MMVVVVAVFPMLWKHEHKVQMAPSWALFILRSWLSWQRMLLSISKWKVFVYVFFFFCCSHTADSSSLRTDSNHSWSCHPHLTQPSSAPSEQQIIFFWAPVKAGSTIHTSLLQWVPLYLCISIIIWFLQACRIACRQRKVWDENSEKINSIV